MLPKSIRKLGGRELKIVWQDGHESTYVFRALRLACPCAVCVEEITGRRLLDPTGVPENLEAIRVVVVGQYALRIDFSDGHNSGIYAFELLRKICPCTACAGKSAAASARANA